MWLVFPMLILLTRFSQRRSLVSGGDQWADHVPRGCSRLIGISRRLGWARHLPGRCPGRGPWNTDGKWMQRRAALAHAPIPDLICEVKVPGGKIYLPLGQVYWGFQPQKLPVVQPLMSELCYDHNVETSYCYVNGAIVFITCMIADRCFNAPSQDGMRHSAEHSIIIL